MKKVIITITLLLSILSVSVWAQYPLQPAPTQDKPIALMNGTAHLGNGRVIENAIITFEKGKITLVADARNAKYDLSGFEVIDITNKHVYPGFILPDTNLGLNEVGAVRATVDQAEQGDMNPNVRAAIAYNTDSEQIPTFRYNGILMAQITPRGGVFSGTSSVMQLDAWNWEDALVKEDEGIHLNWPSRTRGEFDFATFTFKTVPNENYSKVKERLDKIFKDAAAYQQAEDRVENLKLAAVAGLIEGSKTLFVHTDNARSIIESVKFAQHHDVDKVVIVGAGEAHLITDFLKDNAIPVVLTNLHSVPRHPHDDVDLPYKLPYILHKEGIMVSLGYTTGIGSRARSLGFLAGTAAAYGVNKEEALMMITANTAKILGIDEMAGTLEERKDATLFVADGDALDMRTQVIRHAFIQGRKVELDAMQQVLYKKYSQKYGDPVEE